MKKLFALLTILALFAACKKATVSSNKLIGKWELVAITHGMTGKVTNYPIDLGNTIEFSNDIFIEKRNNQVTRNGKYATTRKLSILTGRQEDFVVYENSDINSFFVINDSKLSIGQDAYDSDGYTYQRKN